MPPADDDSHLSLALDDISHPEILTAPERFTHEKEEENVFKETQDGGLLQLKPTKREKADLHNETEYSKNKQLRLEFLRKTKYSKPIGRSERKRLRREYKLASRSEHKNPSTPLSRPSSSEPAQPVDIIVRGIEIDPRDRENIKLKDREKEISAETVEDEADREYFI
jgi:hypothetical protein